ncbi:MAG: PAS domain S-box protein [Nitrospiraceae bacterium]|nr:MAG: PAS domain S-box protein [Nitrospiraceae bacterium]
MKDKDRIKNQRTEELAELQYQNTLSQKFNTSKLHELEKILEILPIGVVYLDSDFRFISANKFIYDMTGLSESDLKDRPCYETLGEHAHDSSKNDLEKICSFCKKDECFKSKKPTVIERPLGDSMIKVTTIPELNDKGNIIRFLEIVEDITERKQKESETLRAGQLAALGEIAAGVAHEINNPINGIINYASIIEKKSGQDDDLKDIAHRIIKEGDRIATIVKSLLAFASTGTGEKKDVSVESIISDSLDLTEKQLRNDGITLHVHTARDVPPVYVQPLEIEQVFLNIINNARYALNQKYSGIDDNKVLQIESNTVMIHNRPYAEISFLDKGTGIPAHLSDKIINPFYSTKPPDIGTGLGLSISNSIIKNHGGKLLIDSLEGEFTRVKIQLPVSGQKQH